MAVVVKERICRSCGSTFQGGPRAWYCPACRKIRKTQAQDAFRRKGRKADRPLGSIDRCIICGKEYVVTSARQKYCPDCAYAAVRAADRPKSRQWNREHRGIYTPQKKAKKPPEG